MGKGIKQRNGLIFMNNNASQISVSNSKCVSGCQYNTQRRTVHSRMLWKIQQRKFTKGSSFVPSVLAQRQTPLILVQSKILLAIKGDQKTVIIATSGHCKICTNFSPTSTLTD